jgi:hypothetical protein
MPFTFTLLSDVRAFLKGTTSVEDELDKVAGSLDELARDTETNADQAADALEHKFTDALDKVRTETKDTGKRMGDDLHDGTRRAGDGLSDFKDEANSTAREAAASFDGSAESIGDAFQEIAANAFAGFGPAGAAAGLAAAAGIGLVNAALQQAQEDAEKATEEVQDFRDQLDEVGNDITKLDAGAAFKKWGEETVQIGTNLIPALNETVTNFDLLTRAADGLGVSTHTMFQAWSGDAAASAEVIGKLKAKQDEIAAAQLEYAQATEGGLNPALTTQNDLYDKAGKALGFFVDKTGQARSVNEWYAAAIGRTTDETEQLTDAQQTAADAAQAFSDTLTDNLSVADEGLDKFVHKGKLSLKEWTAELRRRKAENATIKDFAVDVAPKLSPSALQAFEKLPAETQAQIAKAYAGGGKKGRKQVISNLEAEAKVTKVTVEGGKTDPVTIETKIDAGQAATQAAKAADAAQDEADKPGNRIEIGTRIDRDELQRQVDRAAASITPPTITVRTKVAKEVP